jgi:hypothetical protein
MLGARILYIKLRPRNWSIFQEDGSVPTCGTKIVQENDALSADRVRSAPGSGLERNLDVSFGKIKRIIVIDLRLDSAMGWNLVVLHHQHDFDE